MTWRYQPSRWSGFTLFSVCLDFGISPSLSLSSPLPPSFSLTLHLDKLNHHPGRWGSCTWPRWQGTLPPCAASSTRERTSTHKTQYAPTLMKEREREREREGEREKEREEMVRVNGGLMACGFDACFFFRFEFSSQNGVCEFLCLLQGGDITPWYERVSVKEKKKEIKETTEGSGKRRRLLTCEYVSCVISLFAVGTIVALTISPWLSHSHSHSL